MKFWTTDPAFPDKLVIDMVQCDECDKWIPPENTELHSLFHKQQHQQRQSDLAEPEENNQDDQSLPAFVMETIPCEACMVLVPKQNWDIHKAHACRGRQKERLERQPEFTEFLHGGDEPPLISESNNNYDFLRPAPVMETVECDACHILVPIHNLQLHQAHACTALHGKEQQPVLPTTPKTSKSSYVLGDEDDCHKRMENENEWECPRCTYVNFEVEEDSESHWKCKMCEYSLAGVLDEQDSLAKEQEQPTSQKSSKPQHNGPSFWKNVVQNWVPDDLQKFLPPALTDGNEKSQHNRVSPGKHQPRKKKTTKRRRNHPPSLSTVPSQGEMRSRRNKHLTWLERERQQYLQLLQTTRREQQLLLEQDEIQQVHASKEDALIQDIIGSQEAHEVAEKSAGHSPSDLNVPRSSWQESTQPQYPQLELLQATEQLCLQHLEHLRRTHWVQELTLDIQLLGLPKWRHHLHHLLDLYQSAGEMYIDNIIWELRMHFMQYATLEVLALLELAIWKAQLGQRKMNENKLTIAERRVNRNDRQISIICQSVLPFLGRPLTSALRCL